MSRYNSEYDISIICDDHPKSRRVARALRRKFSAFHFCMQLELGGALFYPKQITNANFNVCTNAILRSRQLIAVLSSNNTDSNAARAALLYAENTGRKPIYICSEIVSLKKAHERCNYDVAFTGASLTWPVLFNPIRSRLKAELAGKTWNKPQDVRIKLYRIITASIMSLAILASTFCAIYFILMRQQENKIPEMDAFVLHSPSKYTGLNFISDDGSLFGDMQLDGKLLVRRTEDNTIIQIIDTAFPNTYAEIIFSNDNKKILVYDFKDTAFLYDIESSKALFKFQGNSDSRIVACFINGGKWFAVCESDGAGRVYEVYVFDTETNELQYSYADDSSFRLWGFTKDGKKLIGSKGENFIWTWDSVSKTEDYNAHAYAGIEGEVDFGWVSDDGKYYLKIYKRERAFSHIVTTEINVCSFEDSSVSSTIKLNSKRHSVVEFSEGSTILVANNYYFALYDQYTEKMLFNIPVIKGYTFKSVDLIEGRKYALCCTMDAKDYEHALIYVVDIRNGQIIAEKKLNGIYEGSRMFPETNNFVLRISNKEGISAYLFHYNVSNGEITFDN